MELKQGKRGGFWDYFMCDFTSDVDALIHLSRWYKLCILIKSQGV